MVLREIRQDTISFGLTQTGLLVTKFLQRFKQIREGTKVFIIARKFPLLLTLVRGLYYKLFV